MTLLTGAYLPVISVTDGSASNQTAMNWFVNPAITITDIPDQTSNPGATIALQVHATDALSGATLTYSATGLPPGLSINPDVMG